MYGKKYTQDLGEQIETMEEVETDENGECIGEITRIHISIDITQPLTKMIFLKQEDGEKKPNTGFLLLLWTHWA